MMQQVTKEKIVASIKKSILTSDKLRALLASEQYKYDIAIAKKKELYDIYSKRLALFSTVPIDNETKEAVARLVSYLKESNEDSLYFARFYSEQDYFMMFLSQNASEVITIIYSSNVDTDLI